MKQEQLEREQRANWERYQALIEELDKPRAQRDRGLDLHELPRLYRKLCAHYALAHTRGYSPGLIGELHEMIRAGYRHMYVRRRNWVLEGLKLLTLGFPRTLRRNADMMLLSCVLFFGSLVVTGLWAYSDPSMIHSIMSADEVAGMEAMYDPEQREPGRPEGREDDSDFAMFGFYVFNNVSIAFRAFAGGVALGIGSAVILLFNGLAIGSVAGHLTRLGYGETFWPFVSGHSALELTAIAIAGAAGLLLGKAIWAPGSRTRLAALRTNAFEAVVLITGAFAMLVLAAVVEAFWSSSGAPSTVKLTLGALSWPILIAYLVLAGRGEPR